MSISIVYGSFTFPAGEPTLSQTRDYVYSANGDRLREKVRVDIEGKYQGSSAAGYEAQMLAMRQALDVVGASFSVSYGGTTTVTHVGVNGTCVMGPRCSSLSFPDGAGPELADGGYRTYRASMEWESEVGSYSRGDLVDFKESITFTQGDPIKQVVNTMNGTALVFTTCGTPAYEATQSGEATGRTAYPTPPSPIWGTTYLISREPIRRESPEGITLDANGTVTVGRLFKTAWSYTFAGGWNFTGGTGAPHRWGNQA